MIVKHKVERFYGWGKFRTNAQHTETVLTLSQSWNFSCNAQHNKMLSYRRETALQGALQFSPKVEDWNWVGDNILRTL